MRSSLLGHLYARPELFRRGQLVYLRNSDGESDDGSKNALKHLRDQIGGGPFKALRIQDTPDSKAAPQRVTLANTEEDKPLMTEDGPLQLSGYFLSRDPE